MSTKRAAALAELSRLVGAHEVGANNRGPLVDKIEQADSLPGIGYAWCQATQNYAWKQATGELLADGTASVAIFHEWARRHGYLVAGAPAPADHVLFWLSGGWNHVGQVERVVSVGATLELVTIEGNTSTAGALLSDANTGRDGIYRKERTVVRGSVSIVRVPGEMPAAATKARKPRRVPAWWWLWASWRLGEGAYAGHALDPGRRPASAPDAIPAWAWDELRAFVGARARR